MSKINKDNLGYLGFDFQVRLIAQFIIDRKFASSIIDIVDPNYFEDQYLRIIAATIKDAHNTYEIIPDMGSLEARLLEDCTDDITRKFIVTQLRKVQEANLNDSLWVQDTAMKFCKQQELKKSVNLINKIIERGDIDDYDKCEDILKKALETGDNKDDGINVTDDIDDVLADDFRKPIPTGITGLDEIMDGGLSKGELAIILAAFGVGKSLANSNRVYTDNSFKKMGEVKVGDNLIGKDGKPTKVLGVYPQGIRPIYKIEFNDQTHTFCDEEHLWAVNTINQRNRSTKKSGINVNLSPDHTFKVMKTSDIMKDLRVWNGRRLKYKIPMVEPVAFSEKEIKLDPYALGVLIGDGYMKESKVTTADLGILVELENIFGVDKISKRETCHDIESNNTLIQNCKLDIHIKGISSILKELNLFDKKSDTKFIPKNYLYNSITNRLNLLQGLLDTDGYASKQGRVQYTTVSKQLAEDVKELVLSLGGTCRIRTKIPTYVYQDVKRKGKLAYTLTISFPQTLDLILFRLKRKQDRVINKVTYANNKFITNISFSHSEEATCIMVDNPDHLFITDDFIVTHNTTMITKIANTAKNLGKNVLQIFFEDMPKVIQRKHLSCWSGYDLNSLKFHKDELKAINEVKKNEAGELRLKKFPSVGTTIPIIRQYIRKCIAQGFRPDLITLDYIDCVQPSTNFTDVNVGEGNVMRQFESLLDEFGIAGWTAVQGNRSSIKSEIVESDQMGGSIKKGQIGHFVVSIAKSLDQREAGTANMAILKSRFGKDGLIFNDITFDNARIQINMGNNTGAKTQSDFNKGNQIDAQQRVALMLEAAKSKRLAINGAINNTAN